MSRVARFKIDMRLDAAGMLNGCTVTIDRDAGLFSVRGKRRHKLYTLPLYTVAGMVVHRIEMNEAAAKRAAKKAKRRNRS